MMSTRKMLPDLTPEHRKKIADGWRYVRAKGLVRSAAERRQMKKDLEAAKAKHEQ